MLNLSLDITLKKILFSHFNDYHFDPFMPIFWYRPDFLPSLSVVIPYYETGETINLTLKHLYNSLNSVGNLQKDWKYEVILIDDGSSVKKARNYVVKDNYQNLKILVNKKNLGRTTTRNKGLRRAKKELCLFLDSDILIDNQLIVNHLKVHRFNTKVNKSSCITASFFRFTDENDPILRSDVIYPASLMLNDWRIHCVYGKTWIGCNDDKKFIGEEMRIVQDTNYFRSWKGMYKVWVISNMVLGGFFMVDRKESLEVGGFNESFKGYGFTETSLATKLTCIKNNFVIPILVGGGVHIEDKKTNLSQSEKDKIFRQKHNYYFNTFLNMSVAEAIKGGV